MKERNKKEEEVSTRESTNLTESKIIISSPNLMLFSRIFLEAKWLQPHINAKNYQYFYQKYSPEKNQPSTSPKIQRFPQKQHKSIIFKKFVSIKHAGQLLKTSIRSRLATDKPQPKLKFSHLLSVKEYLRRFDFTKIKKMISLNLQKRGTIKLQKETNNGLTHIQQDSKWKMEKDSKGIKVLMQAKASLNPIQEENYGLTNCRPNYKGHVKQRSAINLYQPKIAVQKPSAKVFQKNYYLNQDNASTCNSKNRTPQRSLSSSRKNNPTKQVTLKKVTKKPSFFQGKPTQQSIKV